MFAKRFLSLFFDFVTIGSSRSPKILPFTLTVRLSLWSELRPRAHDEALSLAYRQVGARGEQRELRGSGFRSIIRPRPPL